MKICVLGSGYVGLVAGACFSDSGNDVTCADVDQKKIDSLNQGRIPIYEPGLEDLVKHNVKAGRLQFSSDLPKAIGAAEVIFIAVGTPQGEDGSSDLRYVMSAVETIKKSLKGDSIIVLKSTVPVGTSDKVKAALKGVPFDVAVVSNPEFLKEGKAIDDFMRPERVVIGTDSPRAREIMGELYAPFVRSGNPVLYMNNRSAELAKYGANTFLAMKISFINELAYLAEQIGGDIYDIRKAIVTDSRIGNKFLYPGCGYGGSCFPKDVRAIVHLGEAAGCDMTFFRSIDDVNERQKDLIFKKIQHHYGNVQGKQFGIWGLAFKPQTDDMREAPSVSLIRALLEGGATVKAFDPVAADEARRIFGSSITLVKTAYEACDGSDGLAVMTEWNEFRTPDFIRLKSMLKQPTIFDGRNIYEPSTMKNRGFTHYCIGRMDPK